MAAEGAPGFLGGLGPAFGVSELRAIGGTPEPRLPPSPAACSLLTPSGSAEAGVCTLRTVDGECLVPRFERLGIRDHMWARGGAL